MSTRWRSPHHLVSRGRSLQGPTYAFPMLQPQKLCQFLWAYFWKTGLQTLFFETLCSDVHQKFSDFRKVIEYIYIPCCIHPWQDLGHTAHENVFIPRGINEEHTDMTFYCTSLYHASQILRFYKFEGVWSPHVQQVCWHHCPTAFVHSVSLCHILEILAIFQILSSLLCLLWWPVISELWCYLYNSFGVPQTGQT